MTSEGRWRIILCETFSQRHAWTWYPSWLCDAERDWHRVNRNCKLTSISFLMDWFTFSFFKANFVVEKYLKLHAALKSKHVATAGMWLSPPSVILAMGLLKKNRHRHETCFFFSWPHVVHPWCIRFYSQGRVWLFAWGVPLPSCKKDFPRLYLTPLRNYYELN